MRKTDEDSGSGWFDLAVVAPTAESRQSIRPISGQTLGTGALRGPTEPVRNALTSLNRIALYPNPPHTRKVAAARSILVKEVADWTGPLKRRVTNKRKSGGIRVLTVVLSNAARARKEVSIMAESAENRWLSRQELADRYGVPVKTPAEWASKGTGPRYAKFGRHVRYRLSDVIDWEREQFPREKRSTA